MIEYRSFVPMNPDKEEINELEHSPFNLHANEGNIHRYAAGLIPSHWHRELEIFLLLEGRVRIGIGKETFEILPVKAASSIPAFSTPLPVWSLPPAFIIRLSLMQASFPACPEVFLIPAISARFWKTALLI